MKNSKLSKTERELLNAITELLVNTEPETPEDLDNDLRDLGLDPEAMAARIEAVVKKAWTSSPYNWRVQERKKIDAERERYRRKTHSTSSPADLRQRLQRLLDRSGHQLAAAHRNLDEVSDEDIASLLQQYEFLLDDKE